MNPEMKSPAVLIGTLVVLSIILSLILVPRGVELGYLHFRNNEVDEATKDFEHLYAKGDRSATTVSSLIKLAQSRSDPDKAIGYLNEYIDRHPGDMTARRQVLELYREAMKPGKYVETLVRIQELQPTVEQARELEQLYRFSGPDDVHATMLRKLIGMGGGSGENYLALAQFDAATGLPDEALEMLGHGTPLLLKTMNEDAPELHISLLLDRRRVDEALAVARQWVEAAQAEAKPDPWIAVNMAQIFLDHGLTEDARAVVEPVALKPDSIPDIAAFYILVLLDLGRTDDAAAYLAKQNNGEVSLALLPSYIAVDIARHDVPKAFQRAAKFPPQALSAYIVSELARAAIDDGQPQLLAQLRPRFDDRFFHEYPLVATMFFAADNQPAEALKWLDLAEINSTGEIRDLTELEIRLGRRQVAYDRLKVLAAQPENRDFIYQIASILVQDGYAAEALPRFEALRAGHPDLDFGWAIIAAAANNPGVASWLAAQPAAALDATFLEDLYNAAVAGGNKATMLAVASRWDRMGSSNASRVALLDAYMETGDYRSAAALLPAVDPKSVDLTDFYERAVQPAAKAGGPLLQNVSAYWMARLKASTNKADTEQAVDALSDLGQNEQILPQLRQLATEQPAKWGPAYSDALQALGRRDDFVAYQSLRIEDHAMSREDRRDIAYDLLDYGAKQPAERALEINLESETPKSEDFDDLLYLWGPRPSAENRGWITTRAAHARGGEKTAWLNALEAPSDSAASNYSPQTPSASKADRLAEAAQQASDNGDLAAASQSYRQAFDADPGNPTRMRDLAQTEYQQKRYDTAATDFDRYFKAGGKDAQSDFMFGDLLVRQKRNAEATPFFQQSLSQIDAETNPPLQDLEIRAEVLQRLGRIEEARQAYETLLKVHPKNAAIRADYADMLVESGDTDAAQEVVGTP